MSNKPGKEVVKSPPNNGQATQLSNSELELAQLQTRVGQLEVKLNLQTQVIQRLTETIQTQVIQTLTETLQSTLIRQLQSVIRQEVAAMMQSMTMAVPTQTTHERQEALNNHVSSNLDDSNELTHGHDDDKDEMQQ